MAKAVGSRVPTARKANPPLPSELMELAVRLESLARAQEEVCSDIGTVSRTTRLPSSDSSLR